MTKRTPEQEREARLRELDQAATTQMRINQRRTFLRSGMSEDAYRQALAETRGRRFGRS